jgi:hypothetical protein
MVGTNISIVSNCNRDLVVLRFLSKIKNLEFDWISVELREKGMHLLSSDWIGEVQISIQ